MAGPEGPAYMRKDGYFMKAMKRRLLSLLLAMAMVCSLVPTALAVDGSVVANPTDPIPGGTVQLSLSGVTVPTDAQNPTYTWKCDGTTFGTNAPTASYSVSTTTAAGAQLTFSCEIVYTPAATEAAPNPQPVTLTPANAAVTVKAAEPTVSNVGVNPSSLNFTVGTTGPQTVTATVSGTNLTDADKGVTWNLQANDYVELTSAATANPATVQLKAGVTAPATDQTVTLTATSTKASSKSGTCQITIKAPTITPTVEVTNRNLTLYGNTKTTTATFSISPVGTAVTDFRWVSSNPSVATVAATAAVSSTATITAASTGTTEIYATMKVNGVDKISNKVTVTVAGISITTSTALTNDTFTARNQSVTLGVAGLDSPANYSYYWSLSPTSTTCLSISNPNSATPTLYAGNSGNATVYVSVYSGASATGTPIATASRAFKVSYTYGVTATATVYEDSSAYNLSEADDDGHKSVVSQIESQVSGVNEFLSYVVFLDNSDTEGYLTIDSYRNKPYYNSTTIPGNDRNAGLLSDVEFVPSRKGEATFRFEAVTANRSGTEVNHYDGLLTVTVKEGTSGGDIPYTASVGDDVPFDIGDFEDFYYTKTSRGTLDRVTFTMPSGGYLYSDRSRLSASNATCYVSPRSNENDLGSVYFSPTGTTASKATTVRVGFTAYGNRTNVSGTVAITYLNGAAKDISYSTVGGSVTLDPQDFIDAYKEVTGKTAPSNLTIQFQEVPANGTLTYTGGNRDVDLTKSNVRSNKYSTKTTGTYRLNQLTYTGTKGKDTVAYIAYNGSTAQFTGNVLFNGTDAVTPANGTLTMNGSSAAGIDVATSLLGSVTYKPKAGFNNNTDRITFVAYDSRNQLVASGSVNITVVGNTSTTTTPGGVTDVSQFKDVSANAWYRNDLDTLVKAGVITGKGEGKFDPKGTVTYGEALKMVLEACNHTAAVGTGSQWAINYKNLAVSNGWISSSIDLNAPITRNATAELAAKVMGVAPATSGSPFADEANAYAVALYYTNPQIFYGTTNPNGGKPLFENNKPLLREQVCAVICRVRTYNAQQTTDTMPDGI